MGVKKDLFVDSGLSETHIKDFYLPNYILFP